MMLRVLSAIGLAVTLALTSVGLAVARVQPPMTEWIEICGSAGGDTLIVDAQGRPVGPTHLCPDCIAAVAALHLPHSATMPAAPAASSQLGRPDAHPQSCGAPPPVPSARGPPFPV